MVLEEYMFDESYVKLLLRRMKEEVEKTGLGVMVDKTSMHLRCPFCSTKQNVVEVGQVTLTECKACGMEFSTRRLGENYYLHIFEIF